MIGDDKKRYSGGVVSSSSSEKVYSLKGGNKEGNSSSSKGSTMGLMMETVREKFDNVRGRRKSKEPMDREEVRDNMYILWVLKLQ